MKQGAIVGIGVVLAISIAGPACVKKSKYKAATEELRMCQERRDELDRERKQIEADRDQKLKEAEDKYTSEIAATKEEIDELRAQRVELEKQVKAFEGLAKGLRKMIDAGDVKVYIRRGRMIVGLPSGVLFPSGKAELSPRGKKALEQIAPQIAALDRKFLVAGHTDNVPIGKVDFTDNWELSAARALVVTRFLIEKGIPAKNLAAAGYAQYDPVKSNRTRGGRARNRRIELVFMPQLPKLPKSVLPEE